MPPHSPLLPQPEPPLFMRLRKPGSRRLLMARALGMDAAPRAPSAESAWGRPPGIRPASSAQRHHGIWARSCRLQGHMGVRCVTALGAGRWPDPSRGWARAPRPAAAASCGSCACRSPAWPAAPDAARWPTLQWPALLPEATHGCCEHCTPARGRSPPYGANLCRPPPDAALRTARRGDVRPALMQWPSVLAVRRQGPSPVCACALIACTAVEGSSRLNWPGRCAPDAHGMLSLR